jgi:hypothetical protein
MTHEVNGISYVLVVGGRGEWECLRGLDVGERA